MIQVTIHDAQRDLSELIQKALRDERVIITDDRQWFVELVALPETHMERRLGGAKDSILAIADDFDEPLDINL